MMVGGDNGGSLVLRYPLVDFAYTLITADWYIEQV